MTTNTKTHLTPGFLWHQMKAGGGASKVAIPFIPIFIIGGSYMLQQGSTWADSWLPALFGAGVGTMSLLALLIPNPDVFRTFGMNRARARQQIYSLVIPVAVVTAAIALLMNPTWRGGVIAAESVLLCLLYAAMAMSNPETAVEDDSVSSLGALGSFGGFMVQTVWRTAVTVGLVSGVCAGAVITAASYIPFTSLARAFGAMAYFVYLAAFASRATHGRLSPFVMSAFGVPRKKWAAHALPAAVLAGCLYAGTAWLLYSLVPPQRAFLTSFSFIALGASAIAYSIFALGLAQRGHNLLIPIAIFLSLSVADFIKPEGGVTNWADTPVQGIISLALLAIGLLMIALRILGAANFSPEARRRLSEPITRE